jgi:hypothetical protein
MPHLIKQGFEPLRPETLKGTARWKGMWDAFKELVTGTLIPPAENGIIHLDLRPGFNSTANLLFCRSPYTMRMVDMDSLIPYRNWSRRVDKRYLSKKRSRTTDPKRDSALEYLFLKIISLTDS